MSTAGTQRAGGPAVDTAADPTGHRPPAGRRRAVARAPGAAAVQEPLFEVQVRPERRFFRQMLDALTRSGFGDEPLAAETTVSRLFGTVWSASARDGAAEEAVGLGLVEYARHRFTPTSLALLRTLAVVAPIHEVRIAAAQAADGVARHGVPEPPWSPPVGAVTPGRCWALTDVFGDESLLVCEFGYRADRATDARHAIAVRIDHVTFSAAISAAVLGDVDAAVRDLRNRAAQSAPMWALRQVDPAWARGMLSRAFARTDLVAEVVVADDFAPARALAMARVTALPEAAALMPVEPALGSEQLRAVAEEFLASDDAAGLPGPAGHLATVIAEFSAERDPGQVVRVGPRKWEVFLFDWLAHRGYSVEEVAPVVRAWSTWAVRQMTLPRPAAAELAGLLNEMLTDDRCGEGNQAADR